jgi:hypothetical protein
MPVRSGWRGPDCGRAHLARAAAIADAWVRNHRRYDYAETAGHPR